MKTTEHVIIKANFLPKFKFQILDNTSAWIFNNRRKQIKSELYPPTTVHLTDSGRNISKWKSCSISKPLAENKYHTAMSSHFWWWVLTFWIHLRKKCIWHVKKLNVLPLCISYCSACFLNIAIQIMSFNSIYSFNGIMWHKISSHIKKGTGIMIDIIHEVHQLDAT